jgi:Protein of unknown function (DUF3800)
LNIYCDESGGVGRGVMTLAALAISAEDADQIVSRFRAATGHLGELKGSRIDLEERALLFELLAEVHFRAAVSVAISAVKPEIGEDRGDHDIAIYRALMMDAVTPLLPNSGGCVDVFMDDGRYGPEILARVRQGIVEDIGPFGQVRYALSHTLAGLQLADVMANTFFNRALVNDRQARMAATVAPFLEDGRIAMRILDST